MWGLGKKALLFSRKENVLTAFTSHHINMSSSTLFIRAMLQECWKWREAVALPKFCGGGGSLPPPEYFEKTAD
jgi:hypothetical protein